MDGAVDLLRPACAEILGDDDRRAGGQADEKPDDEIQDQVGGPAHRREGRRSHKPPHHHRVGGIVKLLEKGPHQDGEKKQGELLPDPPLRDAVVLHLVVYRLFYRFGHGVLLKFTEYNILGRGAERPASGCGKNGGKCGKLPV